ncbi:MAG: glycoside hydrolase family 3 C-terminal domain-containing protein [Candidatus Marinimicrobia bacterium]|nr:glycoside hydrolase family 3 C-terminal domain-containing protein [Candidatus Neomarinimicrobiota bacterium]MCF7828105.1 glycoside hydrolase family 3 C-terminal domain-containing protein [Candidatus Neomarinimicrobiota bacterium]MCF7879720.1 glycoside hydrolase family 3 C-terminal domain-containing protein [Candidatus Neomarinimicrobiota bacterium]
MNFEFRFSSVCLLVTIILISPDLWSADRDTYYDYWDQSQIHETWIDMNGNGTMEPYENPELSTEKRITDLVSRMTLEEKTEQLQNSAPENHRLGIPDYQWWLEGLHGVTGGDWSMPGVGTVFPQTMGIAASFNTDLASDVYAAVSTEARAKYHHEGSPGLNFYSPGVMGVMRDARWQRTEESFGEDPYLISKIGVATFRAFQGEDEDVKYRKAEATAKHFVANRGPFGRDHPYTDKKGPISERLLREISLLPYEAAIQEGNVGEIMASYSRRPTGLSPAMVPASFSKPLLTGVLREELVFTGHITSDCGAIAESMGLFNSPEMTNTRPGAAAAAVIAGIDVNCGSMLGSGLLIEAVELGLIEESVIDATVSRLFRSRYNLGLFDPTQMNPYTEISADTIGSETHTRIALRAARESMVLLKNEGDLLPLSEDVSSIAVIGPSADVAEFGGYSGRAPYQISPLEGIRKFAGDKVEVNADAAGMLHGVSQAREAASGSEVAIVVVGPPEEGENATRPNLAVPESHLKILRAVHETGAPTIAVLINGSPFASDWLKENVPAILEAWYPGMEGGTAIAEVLFGEYNPGGKLPITFSRPGKEPLYYNHKGEITYDESTYLWPFGYGLSYTDFAYSNLQVTPAESRHGDVTVSVTVENTGDRSGDAVVQMYLRDVEASVDRPVKELKGFDRISLAPGESQQVKFQITPKMLSLYDRALNRVVESGEFEVMIGKSSQDIVLEKTFTVRQDSVITRGPSLEYADLQLSKEEILANEPLFVEATLQNTGEMTGWDETVVMLDGEDYASAMFGIGPNQDEKVSLQIQLYEPGEHKISLGGLPAKTVTVSVREPVFRFDSLNVTSDVRFGEPVDASATIWNMGSREGDLTANLFVDGMLAESKTLSVTPGSGGGKSTVSFRHQFEEPGTHQIGIGNLAPQPLLVWTQLSELAGYKPVKPAFLNSSGKFGNSISVGSDEYIQLVDKIAEITDGEKSSFFPEDGEFTIAFWFKPDREQWGPATLFDATQNPIYFYISGTDSTIGLHFEPADDSDMEMETRYRFQPGQWYHLAAAGRFSTIEPQRLYINGKQIAERQAKVVNHGVTGQPILGASRENYGSPNTGFAGSFDELRMYRRALSAEEIQRIFEENAGDVEGQVLHVSFDE